MTNKWAVLLGGEDIWFIDDKPQRFDSEADAMKELKDEIDACQNAFERGYMLDAGDFDNYRIVEMHRS